MYHLASTVRGQYLYISSRALICLLSLLALKIIVDLLTIIILIAIWVKLSQSTATRKVYCTNLPFIIPILVDESWVILTNKTLHVSSDEKFSFFRMCLNDPWSVPIYFNKSFKLSSIEFEYSLLDLLTEPFLNVKIRMY